MNCLLTTILLLATSMAAFAQMTDFKGYKDPALFTRMPHYFLPSEDSFVYLRGVSWSDYERFMKLRGDGSVPRLAPVSAAPRPPAGPTPAPGPRWP